GAPWKHASASWKWRRRRHGCSPPAGPRRSKRSRSVSPWPSCSPPPRLRCCWRSSVRGSALPSRVAACGGVITAWNSRREQRMKIASWNVNSLRVRLPQVLDWLSVARPDVLAVQETKLVDEQFPIDELAAAGYHAVFHGQPTYNGVALLSRAPGEAVQRAMPDLEDNQARFIAATVGGVRIVNVYVPNGQEVGSDKYAYKLHWLDHLA